ncbi:hypothetical protein BB561_006143 [Smittium simulii]|uniref:Uncharacterized protein n=1 Tax=Smittium simulii TaxID=133385 RepID=A0A2T9Y679_9FUNG|nr:hypothetical protein BB561_006143 [Smittium simulii]
MEPNSRGVQQPVIKVYDSRNKIMVPTSLFSTLLSAKCSSSQFFKPFIHQAQLIPFFQTFYSPSAAVPIFQTFYSPSAAIPLCTAYLFLPPSRLGLSAPKSILALL